MLSLIAGGSKIELGGNDHACDKRGGHRVNGRNWRNSCYKSNSRRGKSSDTTNGLFLPGTEQAVIIATLDHQEKSNWQVWQNNIENTVKTQIKQIIDTATNPTQMLNAAQAAGLAGKLL